MEFDNSFRIGGTPEEIFACLADVAFIAQCVPGATLGAQDEDGAWNGTMTVTFGPKRFTFHGKFACSFDPETMSGEVRGGASATVRNARVRGATTFTVRADEPGDTGQPRSRVDIRSVTELSGILATFAQTGGKALANALVAEFGRNLARRLSEPSAPEAEGSQARLSTGRLVWQATRSKFMGGRSSD